MNRSQSDLDSKRLRRHAEQRLTEGPKPGIETAESISPELIQILVHELRVHQIELELQNEELRRTQAELDASRSRYFDLYDLAPVGYCTLNEQGLILEANLTACRMLGVARSSMTMVPFSRFIVPDDQDQFYLHRYQLLRSEESQSCELRLLRQDHTSVWVQLASSLAQGPNDAVLHRAVLTDITAIKTAETSLRASELLHLSIFDSLSEHVAVLDENGVIIAVNEAWRRYSRENAGSAQPVSPIGVNYFQMCQQTAAENGCHHSTQLLKAMRAVLDGQQSEISLEYPCHSPDQKRWFEVRVTRMLGPRQGLVVSHLNVTNRKIAELALEEGRRELLLVANHVPGPVARIDRDLCYRFANDRYEQFLGRPTEQVIGHRMPEVLGADLFQRVEPHARRALNGEHVSFESTYQHPSGQLRYGLVNFVPDRDSQKNVIGFFVLSIDITERKLAEQARNEALRMLQKVTSRLPGAVYQFRLSPDGRMSMPYSSAGMNSLFGISPEDVQHDAARIFMNAHPDDLERLIASIHKSAQEMTPWTHECRFLIDGTEKWLAGNSTPELEHDGSILWHGFITDVTERREAEAARESLESQLRESQKMEAIGTLAGGIAHDFNNALAAILGNVELAQKELQERESLTPYLSEIYRSGIRARNLVQQILSYCRQQPTQFQRLSLTSVVQDAVAMLRATVPARFSLTLQCDENPSWILADSTQIEQVLINLVTNAVQAIGSRSGSIEVAVGLIDANAPELEACPLPDEQFEHTSQVVRLSVRDDGPGMIPTVQNRIFEPFFTTKPLGEGTGLGLSVVQGIVRLHGGSIGVHSTPGEGTVFNIYFPAIIDDADQRSLETEPLIQTSATRGTDVEAGRVPNGSRNVLLIDDDDSVLKISKLMLERNGYTVSAFSDPLTAIDVIRKNPEAFHLVITDYNMPVMPGLAVAAVVRDVCPHLPIAMTSGFVDDPLRAGASQAGVTELISKPFNVKELSEKLDRILRSPR